MNKKYLIAYGLAGLSLFLLNIFNFWNDNDRNFLSVLFEIMSVLLGVYFFILAFKQNNINKYTNWALVFWYVGSIIGTSGLVIMAFLHESIRPELLVILAYASIWALLAAPVLSVCLLVAGLVKGTSEPEKIVS